VLISPTASSQPNILLEPLPYSDNNTHLHRQRRLARLQPLPSPFVAQHIASYGVWRFSLLPLCAPHYLRYTSLLLSSLSINGDGAEDFSSNINGEEAECVIYTPHGIPHEALSPIAKADPPLHTLAFLHGLHDVSISSAQQLNLGAKNGVLAQRILRAKYWVATHDEVKKGGGFISWFLRRKVWTVEDALKEARADDEGEFTDVRFQDMRNGESRVLE
jgi:hypothetical protein